MIRPGLLTASTNKADQLGTSGAGLVACCCIGRAPFAARGFGLGLKTVFPPRRDVGIRVGARTHTRRGETERSTQNVVESCASGLSWHNRPAQGETKLDFSAGMERTE